MYIVSKDTIIQQFGHLSGIKNGKITPKIAMGIGQVLDNEMDACWLSV